MEPNTVILLAWSADLFGGCLSQVGLIIQKLSHRHQEQLKERKKQERLATENSEGVEGLECKDDDDSESVSTYCSWRFWVGFSTMTTGQLIHILCLPFLNMSLLAVNCALAIIVSVGLSIVILKEQFILRYDLTGLATITLGSTFIVLCTSQQEQEFTDEEAVKILFSVRTCLFTGSVALCSAINSYLMKRFNQKLRDFESDVDRYQNEIAQQHSSSDPENTSSSSRSAIAILPPREKLSKTSKTSSTNEPLLALEEEVERPTHMLIDVLHQLDKDIQNRVSPQSTTIKSWIKAPMIALVVNSALVSSISVLLMKLGFEMIWNDSKGEHYVMIPVMIMTAVCTALFNLHLLNQAMKYYKQMEAVPVYQTALLIFWILTGLLILDEKQFYSWGELSCVAASVFLCFIGIKILTMKRILLETQHEQKEKHGDLDTLIKGKQVINESDQEESELAAADFKRIV